MSMTFAEWQQLHSRTDIGYEKTFHVAHMYGESSYSCNTFGTAYKGNCVHKTILFPETVGSSQASLRDNRLMK